MQAITFALQARINELRGLCGHELSSHAFPSLYLWQGPMGLEYHETGNCFAVRAAAEGPNSWFFPCGSEESAAAFIEQHLNESDFRLLYLREADASWLNRRWPGLWAVARAPEADEYLYDRQEHLDMAGGRYAAMRQRSHKIERAYAVRTAPLTEATHTDAVRVLEAWNAGAVEKGPTDSYISLLALGHCKQLSLAGTLVYLDELPSALVLGFALSEDTFDVAVGKSIGNVQGLTFYALRQFFAALPPGCRRVNLEEDLGLAGLRAMKTHFLPACKNKIWEARRK